MSKKPKLSKAIRARMDADPAATTIRKLQERNDELVNELWRCQLMHEMALAYALNKSDELERVRAKITLIDSVDTSDPYGWRRSVLDILGGIE